METTLESPQVELAGPIDSVLTTSNEFGKISKALAQAQSEIEMSEKDGVNPHFQSSYSTLSSSIKVGKGPATKYGLSIIQANTFEKGAVVVLTLISHESNQWIKNLMTLPVTRQDIHTIKSTVTYGRRMAYEGLLCIAPKDDDDDGNAGADKKAVNQEEVTKMKLAKKQRAVINKAFAKCNSMVELEKRAKEFKGNVHGFWDTLTHGKAGETYGKVYLNHKDRIQTRENLYSDDGQLKWREGLANVKTNEEFYRFNDMYFGDLKRQTLENEFALQSLAQEMGLWDEESGSILEKEK